MPVKYNFSTRATPKSHIIQTTALPVSTIIISTTLASALMIEPGFPTLLAHPALSCALAALAIGLAAWLMVRGGTARRGERGAVYWRVLTLGSEVLLALGLVGLVIFAGRITVAADQVVHAQRVLVAQTAVDQRVRDIVAAQCVTRPGASKGSSAAPANLTPFNPGMAANELCALARARPGAEGSVLDWQSAAHELRAFGQRYPGCVDNVFSRNNDCESTVGSATALAGAIDQLTASMQDVRANGAGMLAIQGERDWGFALLAAFLAAAGMAIRIARAVAKLLDAGR